MYLIQLLNNMLCADLEQRIENSRLKPIQPGQSLSSGWVERTPEGAMIEFPPEGDTRIFATYMVEERKLSKKDIKLEADARAKAELQKFVDGGQSRYVDSATGAVNAKAIRQEVMDEMLEKSIPKRTAVTVEFCYDRIVAIHTNNALHLDSIVHSLGIDDEIEWRLTPLDTQAIFEKIVSGDGEHILEYCTSISFLEEDDGSINAKNVDIPKLLERYRPSKIKSISLYGFTISHKGCLKLEEEVEYGETVAIIRNLQGDQSE